MGSITRKEWIRVVGFALFVIALTTLPYLLAWSQQTPDHAFSGALFGVEDANSYLGKMRIGARGEWEFTLFYTAEPTQPEPGVFLFYIAAGQIVGRLVSDPAQIPAALMIGFQALRILADFALILAAYRFIAHFVTHERVRYNALVLAALAGGLGWLTVIFQLHTAAMPDLTIPEGFGFLVLYGLPHVALARAALLIGLLCVMPHAPVDADPPENRRRYTSRLIAAGVLFNLVGLLVPFYVAVLYVILGVWGLAALLIQRRFPAALFWRCVTAAALTVPLFLYNTIIYANNPAFAQWSAQNLLPSPPLWEYVLAYAPLVVCAGIAVRCFWRHARASADNALLIGWLAAAPVLAYLPINVQRRLIEGVIVPLAILAAWGIRQLVWRDQAAAPAEITHKRRRTAITGGILVFLCATSILWVATGALAPLVKTPPTYIDGSEIRAFAWLQAHAQPGDRVMASIATGNALPVYTDLRPLVGLGPETLLSTNREQQTIQYYRDAMTPAEREIVYDLPCSNEFMPQPEPLPDNCRIRWVMWGANERELLLLPAETILPAAPSWMDGLTLVYQDGDTSIYQVPPAQGNSS